MGTHQGNDLSQDARRHEQNSAHHPDGVDAAYRQWREQHIGQMDADFDAWKRERQGQAFNDFHDWRKGRTQGSA